MGVRRIPRSRSLSWAEPLGEKRDVMRINPKSPGCLSLTMIVANLCGQGSAGRVELGHEAPWGLWWVIFEVSPVLYQKGAELSGIG